MHSIMLSFLLIASFVIPMGLSGHLHMHHGHGHGGLAGGGGGGGGVMNMGQFRSGHTGYIRPRLHGDMGHVRHYGHEHGMRSLLSEGMMSQQFRGRGYPGSGPAFRALDPRRPHIHSHGMI